MGCHHLKRWQPLCFHFYQLVLKFIMRNARLYIYISLLLIVSACKKGADDPASITPATPSFSFQSLKVNGGYNGFTYYNINYNPVIKFSFSTKINQQSVSNAISFRDKSGTVIPFTSSLENNDSTVVLQPSSNLSAITKYVVSLSTTLKSQQNGSDRKSVV